MTKFLKLFSLLIMSIFFNVFAESIDLEKYQLSVTQVDPESNCFVLSNGMTCCMSQRYRDSETPPNVGTKVFLLPLRNSSENKRANMKSGEFVIKDYTGTEFLVWVPVESEQYFLTIVSCKSACAAPHMGVYENIIELSDGSKWATFDDHTYEKGNRVIVSDTNRVGYKTWRLINVDRVVHVAASKNNESHYSALLVSPYENETKTP